MTLAATGFVDFALRHGLWIVFVFMFGACVGSFANVVVWRMPRGMSLSNPPSRCPTCGGRLRFFRENLPILGWLFLRGKCRFCAARISPVYPLVELAFAVGFLLLYVFLFVLDQRSLLVVTGGDWWTWQRFALAWPAYSIIALLFSSLAVMTVIDARTFLIPIAIPTFITAAALVLWAAQALFARSVPVLPEAWPLPGVGWVAAGVGVGGLMGVLVSTVLLRIGLLRYSFADYEDYLRPDHPIADYPHARREMWVEVGFLLGPILGMVLGGSLAYLLWGSGEVPPLWIQAVGGSLLGWLVGGGLVWGVRILGTLGFGREAMGLGDVHLLAAVGAVFGWFMPILIFFVAPFLGLLWTLVTYVAARMRGGVPRELPYGPHLAVATLLVFAGQSLVLEGWRVLLPTVEMPRGELLNDVDDRSGWTGSQEAVPMVFETSARRADQIVDVERRPPHVCSCADHCDVLRPDSFCDRLRDSGSERSNVPAGAGEHRAPRPT